MNTSLIYYGKLGSIFSLGDFYHYEAVLKAIIKCAVLGSFIHTFFLLIQTATSFVAILMVQSSHN